MKILCDPKKAKKGDKVFKKPTMENSEKKQLLRDPTILPTDEVLAVALKESFAAFLKFENLVSSLNVELNWRFYNDGKAWLNKGQYKWKSSRGNEKERTIFWLSIWDGFFRVSFFIPEKRREDFQTKSIREGLRKRIECAKTMGKLKFFPIVFDVDSDEFLDDFNELINFQKEKN